MNPQYRVFIDDSVIGYEYYFSKNNNIELIVLPAIDLQKIINGQKGFTISKTDIFIIRSKVKFKKGVAVNLPGFIGSSVSGEDHLDISWLENQGVEVFCAKGCNADSVRDYILAVLIELKVLSFDLAIDLAIDSCKPKVNKLVGVIGYGHVGSKVADLFYALGFKVIIYDPFVNKTGNQIINRRDYLFANKLDELCACNIISMHCSLTNKSDHGAKASESMINKSFIQKLKPGAILLNASRGEVINEADLLKYAKNIICCLDVWRNEPEISQELVLASKIATPHIAGHSIDAKIKGLHMVYEALVAWSNLNKINYFNKINMPELSGILNIYNGVMDKSLKLSQMSELLKHAASLDLQKTDAIRNMFLKLR